MRPDHQGLQTTCQPLWRLLWDDLQHAAEHDQGVHNVVKAGLKRKIGLLVTPNIMLCLLHRLAHACRRRGHTRCACALAWLNLLINRAAVDPACEFGGGLYVPHPAGVVLRGHAGRRLVVLAHATMAAPAHLAPEQWPRAGDGVCLGARSLLLPGAALGHHSKAGPGAWISGPLPEGWVRLAHHSGSPE